MDSTPHRHRLKKAAHPISGDLRGRAVGIEQSHHDRRSLIQPKNQSIGSNAGASVAEFHGELGGVRGHLIDEGDEKVVSETVMFGEMHPTSM